jgi:hypothetical protein
VFSEPLVNHASLRHEPSDTVPRFGILSAEDIAEPVVLGNHDSAVVQLNRSVRRMAPELLNVESKRFINQVCARKRTYQRGGGGR